MGILGVLMSHTDIIMGHDNKVMGTAQPHPPKIRSHGTLENPHEGNVDFLEVMDCLMVMNMLAMIRLAILMALCSEPMGM